MRPLKTNFPLTFCVVIFAVITFFACNEPAKNPQKNIDRTKLTDEQKRLPENAVSAFKVAP